MFEYVPFNTLCDKMRNTPKAFIPYTEVWWLIQRKALVKMSKLLVDLAAFFMENHFYLEKSLLTDRSI